MCGEVTDLLRFQIRHKVEVHLEENDRTDSSQSSSSPLPPYYFRSHLLNSEIFRTQTRLFD